MEALYFGTSRHPLFGVYEPPVDRDLRRGVVICSPVGEEYYRAYRACRALARRISSEGGHVLRFDYIGTGNSGGEVRDFHAADWLDNVMLAIDELKDMTGLRGVTLIGLRHGTALVLKAAEARRDVREVVLWEPWNPASQASTDTGEFTQVISQLEEWATPPSTPRVPTLVIASRVRDVMPTPPATGSQSIVEIEELPGPSQPGTDGVVGAGGLPVVALAKIAGWVAR